jgi:hypothetical protein
MAGLQGSEGDPEVRADPKRRDEGLKDEKHAYGLEERAVELWAKEPAPDAETRFERSRVLTLLAGLGGEATSGAMTGEAAAFGGQAVAALGDAISTGWNGPDELKEPDFDALRGWDDFKKLLAEVEARNKAKPAKKEPESK